MTRLTEHDVRRLSERLEEFEESLRRVTGCGLLEIAVQAADAGPRAAARLAGARLAVVPVSAGEGFIPGFAECVAAILAHLGCDAFVTPEPDMRGWQAAAAGGAEAVFAADDYRFLALNIHNGVCVDDDPATAAGFVAALSAAAGGLAGRPVLVLGLGPVGRAAVARLRHLGAEVLAVERDEARVAEAAAPRAGVPSRRPRRGSRRLPARAGRDPQRRPGGRLVGDRGEHRGGARPALGVHRRGSGGSGRPPHPRAAGARGRRDGRPGPRLTLPAVTLALGPRWL